MTTPFDEHLHPALLERYASKAIASVEEVARCQTRDGPRFYQRPIPPPSLCDFAASIGVSKQDLARWRGQHPPFDEACSRAESAFEAACERMGLLNAWPSSVSNLVMKNLHQWGDRREINVSDGRVHLYFDAQDELT